MRKDEPIWVRLYLSGNPQGVFQGFLSHFFPSTYGTCREEVLCIKQTRRFCCRIFGFAGLCFAGPLTNPLHQMKRMPKADWWFLLVLLELAVPATIIWLRSAH